MSHPLTNFETYYNFLFHWNAYGERHHLWQATVHDIINIVKEHGEAKQAVAQLRESRETGHYDVMLMKSITAAVALHKSGYFSQIMGGTADLELGDTQYTLQEALYEPYNNKKEVAKAYGLSAQEIRAIEAYTSPNKEDETSPHYMRGNYGDFSDGWDALTSALRKLPSFGDLGLTVCTFRVTRNAHESQQYLNLKPGISIKLGVKMMSGGQYHQTSTSISYSVHLTPDKVRTATGVLAYFGVSGVYINWLGLMSPSVDGCEVLYPPGTVMKYAARMPCGYTWNGENFPVYILEERPCFLSCDVDDEKFLVDDFTFSSLRFPSGQ